MAEARRAASEHQHVRHDVRVSEEECDEWQRETVLNDRSYTNPLCMSSSTESTRDIQSTDGANAIAGHAGGLCGM
jgi:hypothetical protein